MIEKMKERKTIRKYRQEDVPESLVEELLEVASRASNTGNMQLQRSRNAGCRNEETVGRGAFPPTDGD